MSFYNPIEQVHDGGCFAATGHANHHNVFRQSVKRDVKRGRRVFAVLLNVAERQINLLWRLEVNVETDMVVNGIAWHFLLWQLDQAGNFTGGQEGLKRIKR